MVNSPATERRICRAAQAVSCGLSVEDVVEIFLAEGVSPGVAFLAAVAGRILADNPRGITVVDNEETPVSDEDAA